MGGWGWGGCRADSFFFGQARAKNNNEFIQSDGAKEESSMEPLPMKMLMGLSPSPSPPSHNNPKMISRLVSWIAPTDLKTRL